MTDEFKKARDEASISEHIYEPKWGGKDHSGYDTIMKYEVNSERDEAFCNGADWAYEWCGIGKTWVLRAEVERVEKQADKLAEALEKLANEQMHGAANMRHFAKQALAEYRRK